jgi:hypothetical protein
MLVQRESFASALFVCYDFYFWFELVFGIKPGYVIKEY